MTYHLSHPTPLNSKSADVGTSTFNTTDAAFLVMDAELDLRSLKEHFSIFLGRFRASLHRGFGQSVSTFPDWNPEEVEERSIAREGEFLMAFKPIPGTSRLQYFGQGPVLDACIAMELISRLTPHGKSRTNAPKGSGGLPKFLAKCPIETQREVLARAISETSDLDDLFRLAQGNSFHFDQVEQILATANDAWTALDKLVPLVAAFIEVQTTQWSKSKNGRSFGAALFFGYLAGVGVLLWPTTPRQMVYLVPDVLRPIWWEVLSPQPMCSLVKKLANARDNNRAITMLRRLLLTTDIFVGEQFELNDFWSLLEFRHHTLSSSGETVEREQHELNVLFRLILRFTNRTFEDVPDIAPFFGGGKRSTSPRTQAFGWVQKPAKGKVKHINIFGREPPDKYPEHIHSWASYLSGILPGFQNRSFKTKRDSLDYWLYYLTTLPAEAVPASFKEVERREHIASPDLAKETFTKFIAAHAGAKAPRILADWAQAWKIAATTHAFDELSNPLDAKQDSPSLSAAGNRRFQTRRRAMGREQVNLLRSINTRDGFAFARSLGRFDKKVPDGRKIFWPALPIILELILSVALRSHSAIWADSGEGDEFWCSASRSFPNDLPTATPGRQAGILQRHQISHDQWVLGMRVEVVKTDAFSTPWIDDEVIEPIIIMRDWQIAHNPKRAPILALRDAHGPDFNPTYHYRKVFPLFRDPEDPSGRPPTWSTVDRYWRELLLKAETEVNSGQPPDKHARFFIDKKPIWDLHSLRVSFVTNARDSGIPLEAVQQMTGQSALMASYYDVHRSVRAHQAFVKAKETERERIAASLKDTTAFTSQDTIEKLIGGAVVRPSSPHVGMQMLHWAVQSGQEVQVFSHGICPAARCDQGNGEGSVDKPVFRPMACSRCQFRVTGARFVNGLAIRTNALAIEQTQLIGELSHLNRQLQEAEDTGQSTRGLQEAIERKSDELDEVNREWSVEYATCKLAERKARQWDDNKTGDVVAEHDNTPLISLEGVHPLTLIQGTLDASEVIVGGSISIPPGTEAMRNDFLYEISYHNKLDEILISVDPKIRRAALHKFGQLIIQHAYSVSTEPSAYIADLVEGSVSIDPNHRIGEKLATALSALISPSPQQAIA